MTIDSNVLRTLCDGNRMVTDSSEIKPENRMPIHDLVKNIEKIAKNQDFKSGSLPANQEEDQVASFSFRNEELKLARGTIAALKARLIIKRSWTYHRKDTLLISAIFAFFRDLFAYTRLISRLTTAENSFSLVSKKLIQNGNELLAQPLTYTESVDCKRLLKKNGFNENGPFTTYLQSRKLKLSKRDEFSSPEEIFHFNQIVKEFFRNAFQEAVLSIEELSDPSREILIHGTVFDSIQARLDTTIVIQTEEDALAFLEEHGLDATSLFPERLKALAQHLADEKFCYRTDNEETSLSKAVRDFTKYKGSAVTTVIEYFAEDAMSSPLDLPRAKLLLQNLGYEENNALAKFLVSQNLAIRSYSQLTNSKDNQAFNACVFKFLETTLSDSFSFLGIERAQKIAAAQVIISQAMEQHSNGTSLSAEEFKGLQDLVENHKSLALELEQARAAASPESPRELNIILGGELLGKFCRKQDDTNMVFRLFQLLQKDVTPPQQGSDLANIMRRCKMSPMNAQQVENLLRRLGLPVEDDLVIALSSLDLRIIDINKLSDLEVRDLRWTLCLFLQRREVPAKRLHSAEAMSITELVRHFNEHTRRYKVFEKRKPTALESLAAQPATFKTTRLTETPSKADVITSKAKEVKAAVGQKASEIFGFIKRALD